MVVFWPNGTRNDDESVKINYDKRVSEEFEITWACNSIRWANKTQDILVIYTTRFIDDQIISGYKHCLLFKIGTTVIYKNITCMYISVKMFLQTTNNKNYKVPLKNHKSSVNKILKIHFQHYNDWTVKKCFIILCNGLTKYM